MMSHANNRKKRKNTATNPLSHARGKQQRPENIWFRKDGTGYTLFLQYYAAQPNGVVVDFGANSSTTGDTSVKSPPTAARRGEGQSRASKRRNKRKQKSASTDETGGASSSTTHENATSDSSQRAQPPSAVDTMGRQHPLLQHYHELVQQSQKSSSIEQFTRLHPFIETMSRPLPLTFRLRHSADPETTSHLVKILQTHHPEVVPLPFGDGSIYQASSLSKAAISDSLKELLVQHSQNGTLARQELGSMLPVLALVHGKYLQQKCRVLDMCASPGSKTLQALERTALTGKVLANDVLQSRLEALQQAVERSGMPINYTKRIQYSCCDASQLQTTKQYHVILCDVPCSGDGTCRKDKHILPMWKPNHGNRLHETQVKILVRAMQLLKKGGVVCYSTCSLNPVENEAVVAAALCRMNGAVQLVDFPYLPGFTQRPGVGTWRVAHYTDEGGLVWYDTYQEAVDNRMDDKPLTSMWPPSSVDDTSSENDNLHLERCTRLWPQDHDSGGFFLALLQKTSKS